MHVCIYIKIYIKIYMYTDRTNFGIRSYAADSVPGYIFLESYLLISARYDVNISDQKKWVFFLYTKGFTLGLEMKAKVINLSYKYLTGEKNTEVFREEG